MKQTIRIELPEGVSAEMPFVGAAGLTSKQVSQIRQSEPRPKRVLEINRTDEALEWRCGNKTYSTLLSDVHRGLVEYAMFMGMPLLTFVLFDQPDAGGYSLMTFGQKEFLPGTTELGLEGWFREFAKLVDPMIPGGVTIRLEWPLKS